MPVTGKDILDYSGSGGLGSNADVPAIATKSLDVINNSLDRIQGQNSIHNQNLFNQKIKDRDALIAAIDSGDVKVGDLLEKDMPIVKEGLDKLDEAYFARIKKGINDLDAAREYKKALRDAQDRVTQAQARKVYFDGLNTGIAKETLPRKQQAMKEHLDKTINGGFFKDLTPYQQTQDLDIAGSILSTAATATEQFTDPKNPLVKGKRTLFDYEKTQLNNKDNFLNDANKRHDQKQLMAAIQSQKPQDFLDTIKAMNERIKEYNATKGLTADQPGYVEDVKFTINPQTGAPMIDESLPDFAAKYTLSHQKPFVSSETEIDKAALELAKLKQDQAELASLDRNRRGQLGLDWAKFDYLKEEDKYGAAAVINEAKDIIKKGQEFPVEEGGKKVMRLRIGDPNVLKSFGTVDKDGKTTNVPDALEYDRKTDQVKLIYYRRDKDGNLSPTESGKNFIDKSVSLDQRTWLKEIAKRSFPNKDIGKVNSLIDRILNDNGNSLYKISEKSEADGTTISINEIPLGTKPEKKGNEYFFNGKKVITD